MRRWIRPAGLAASLAFVVIMVVLGLRSGPGELTATADVRNGRAFIQDNLWSTARRQYAVWVTADGTPHAGWRPIDGGDWKLSDLSRIRGNPLATPTADDSHNIYVIAADGSGGVHVAGNMHGDPLRYVRSAGGDLGAWAARPAPRANDEVSYPAFTALPDGTLLFWHHEGLLPGPGRTTLASLAPGSSSWRTLGTIVDGRPTDESPYLHHVAVDPRSGVIHLLFEWRKGVEAATNSDVGYARSSDGGRTWETSAGAPLELPITHASAETVIDTRPVGSGLLNQGGLTVDSSGRPHGVVTFSLPGGGQVLEHVWLDDGAWRREQLGDLDLDGRPQLAGTPDGRVWLLGVHDRSLEAIDITPDQEHASTREVAQVPPGWEPAFDSQALALYGRVEMLIPEGDRPNVVEVDLAP